MNSSIVDDVSFFAEYRYDQKWKAWMSLGWNRRQEISDDLLASTDRDLTRYRVVGNVTRNILPRLDVVARVDYIHRTEKRQLQTNPVTESVTGFISLRYNFDPIVF